MTVIYLGNRDAIEVVPALGPDGEPARERRQLPGKRVTIVKPPPDLTFRELLHDLTHPDGIWAAHSDAEAPAWVACTDAALGARLAAFYGCELREVEA